MKKLLVIPALLLFLTPANAFGSYTGDVVHRLRKASYVSCNNYYSLGRCQAHPARVTRTDHRGCKWAGVPYRRSVKRCVVWVYYHVAVNQPWDWNGKRGKCIQVYRKQVWRYHTEHAFHGRGTTHWPRCPRINWYL